MELSLSTAVVSIFAHILQCIMLYRVHICPLTQKERRLKTLHVTCSQIHQSKRLAVLKYKAPMNLVTFELIPGIFYQHSYPTGIIKMIQRRPKKTDNGSSRIFKSLHLSAKHFVLQLPHVNPVIFSFLQCKFT